MEDHGHLMGYAVAVPLAIVRTNEGGLIHLYEGQPVPGNADPKDVERLADGGFVAAVNGSAVVPAEPVQVEKPAGNASFEEWAAYAVETGQATADELKGLSRNELRELYG